MGKRISKSAKEHSLQGIACVRARARDFAAEIAEIDERIDRLGGCRLGFGRYKHKTLAQIMDHQPTYLGWVLSQCFTQPVARLAVRLYFEALVAKAVVEKEAAKEKSNE